MKKFFAIMMVALAATFSFTSCDKEGGKDNGKGGNDEVKQIARIKTMGSYEFAYNADGTVKSVTEVWEGGSESHVFEYSGTSLKIKVDGAVKYDCVLNDKGLATSVKNCNENVTYTYEYDKNGFCINCKKDGKDQCQQLIDDMCVQYWTRAKYKDDGSLDHFRHKDHTYTTVPNVGNLHPEWAEDFGQKRWFYETGLLGRASAYIMLTAQWDDAEKIAKYEYEYDENKLVLKETKMYGLPDALEFDDDKVFTWEML